MRRQGLQLLCVLVLLGCGAASVYAQAVSGTLLGTITDATGASVPNAQVVATETNTGVSRTTATGEAGNYVVADLPPGIYSVSVELTAFLKPVSSTETE